MFIVCFYQKNSTNHVRDIKRRIKLGFELYTIAIVSGNSRWANAVASGKNPGIMQRHQKEGKKQPARRAGAKFLRAMFYFPTAGGGRVKARIHRRPAKIYRSKYRARALDSVEVYKGPCPVTTNFYSHPLPFSRRLALSVLGGGGGEKGS